MEECLVTRTVPNEEVRANLQEWIPAMEDEYKPASAWRNQAIVRGGVQGDQERARCAGCNSRFGGTVKAPNARKKCRIVGCDNFASKENAITDKISAGGIDGIALRALVSSAARRNWTLASVDVKTAFLQAARRETPGRVTLIQPPGMMVRDSGLLKDGPREMWQVTGAMYGLLESPKDWSVHRDRVMSPICWTSSTGDLCRLEPTGESHLWKVSSSEERRPIAFVGVYMSTKSWFQEKNLRSLKSWSSSMASSNWHRWSGLDCTNCCPFLAFKLGWLQVGATT